MNARDLLQEIQIVLECEHSKLIHLPQKIVIIDDCIGDLTLAHLKCSIAVTAAIRAQNCFEQTGKPDLEKEHLIKKYLLQVICVNEDANEALRSILWLCLHIQKSPFSNEEHHNEYIDMLTDVTTSLETATVQPEFQTILARSLERVSEIPMIDLDNGLTTILLKALNVEDVEDLKHNLRALKVKAIDINSQFLSESLMGWSSSGEIFICSDNKCVRDALNGIKNGECVSQAKLIVDSLVLREGGHSVARKRARDRGNDPTLFSTPSSDLKSSTSISECPSVNECGLETGCIMETIVFGAVLDPVRLWLRRQEFHAEAEKRVPLHGLCRWCGVRGAKSASLPITPSKDIPALGFSCRRRRRMLR
jgi:hypothetical protein